MAIQPPSDIILDVARAADPGRARAAADRLRTLALAPPDQAPTFDAMMEAAIRPAPHPGRSDSAAVLRRMENASALRNGGSAGEPPAYRRFEAFVLQTFVEAVLPKDTDGIFGKGMSGSVWRSMFAEQIAGQIAKAGGIGIADAVLAAHPAGAAGPASDGDAAPAYQAAAPVRHGVTKRG